MSHKAIGVDLGGTFIKAGVVDANGKVLSRVKRPTQPLKGRDQVIANIAAAAEAARRKAGLPWAKVRAVGLGAPGVFIQPHGLVHLAVSLKCLTGDILAKPVAEALGRPEESVVLENDANVAAYAESWIGCGREASSLVLFTLGTGIGGGIVLNDQLWHGAWGVAAELGHQTIVMDGRKCLCGNKGCVEAYASAPAIAARFAEAGRAGRRSRLAAKEQVLTIPPVHPHMSECSRTCSSDGPMPCAVCIRRTPWRRSVRAPKNSWTGTRTCPHWVSTVRSTSWPGGADGFATSVRTAKRYRSFMLPRPSQTFPTLTFFAINTPDGEMSLLSEERTGALRKGRS